MAVNAPETVYKNPIACASGFGRFFTAQGSFLYYSKVLQGDNDVGRCYQQNDPTSTEIPDLLDTDGGVIEIENSINIKALKSFRSGILIFAGNGVWYISNPDGGFKATAFNLEKITERGLENVRSIILAQNDLYYFSSNGIIKIAVNEFNNLGAMDITEETIRTHFLQNLAGKKAQGVYDSSAKQCVWWNRDSQDGIVFDLQLQAFYPQKQANPDYKIAQPFDVVNAVYYPSELRTATNVTYSFASYMDETFKDFGIDQDAFIITGYETLGKFANKKSVGQAKVVFRKTEKNITGYEDNSYVFDKPSSCLFQARWDFDNSDVYGKFTGDIGTSGKGKVMQLYKPMQRGFIPDSYPYVFDTGESVISKKFNIRGNGDAVQFVFKTEPEKDLQLLGYSVNYTMRGRM